MPYRLEPNETISLGIRRLLLERVDQIIDDLTNPAIDRDEGVHEARKNCKRVRAAYRLIRDEIGKDLYRQENIRFRDTARLLAGARDSWVMIQTLDKLVASNEDRLPPRSFAGIQEELKESYKTTLAGEFETQERISAILDRMAEAKDQIEQLPIERNDFSAFRKGIRRVYKRGRNALSTAYYQPHSEVFHEWRKRCKYLWYQLEILEALWPNVLSRLAEELHTLSDYLGDDHDLAVLRSTILDTLTGLKNEKELLAVVHLIDQERLELEALAHPLGERLYFDPPDTFVERLETFWQAWQKEHKESQNRIIERIQDRSPIYIRPDQDFLTTTEMATSLGISPKKVRQLIFDQKIPAEKVGSIWVIRADHSLQITSQESGSIVIGELMTTREAASHLEIKPNKVREYIQSGELKATKKGNRWILSKTDLDTFKEIQGRFK